MNRGNELSGQRVLSFRRGLFVSFMVILSVLFSSSCSPETVEIWLFVTTDFSVPDELDELELWMTAASSRTGNFCVPLRHRVPIYSQSDLPVPFVIQAGDEYRSQVLMRVLGRLRTETVIAQEKRAGWPEEGVNALEIVLESRCSDITCSVNEQCYCGSCVHVPVSGAFDDESMWDVGVSCDRLAPIEEADSDEGGDARE